MKLLKNTIMNYEFYALILSAVFFSIVLYWAVKDYISKSLSFTLAIVLLADGTALYFTIRKLWRTKWRNRVVSSFQKVFSKLAKQLLNILEKWNIIKGDKTTVLGGKTTISFDFPQEILREKKAKKQPKWKQLGSDRERLGYLYKQLIEQRIKHGLLVYSSETPSEIKIKSDNEDFENEIYDLYIANRYRQTVDTDTEALNELKSKLYK